MLQQSEVVQCSTPSGIKGRDTATSTTLQGLPSCAQRLVASKVETPEVFLCG